jgi:hypothetical protein
MSTEMTAKAIFARYIKLAREEKEHSTLSASGSERWLGCPASVRLSKGRPSVEHASAQVGTNAHTLLQFCLEQGNWYALLKSPAAAAFKKSIGYTTKQLSDVTVAVDYIFGEYASMAHKTGREPELHIEKSVSIEGVGKGTSDVILYQPFGLLHVIDYKNGKYKVSPKDNTQGLYYGVGAADEFGWDFKEIWITIIQPNGSGEPIKTWKTTPDRLERAKLMFQRGAAATKKKDAPAIPNHKHCWFCPARQQGCPAQQKERDAKILSRFQRT